MASTPWTVTGSGGKLEVVFDSGNRVVTFQASQFHWDRVGERVELRDDTDNTTLLWDNCTSTGHTPGDYDSFGNALEAVIDSAAADSDPEGTVDSGNSTTTPLAAGATFTGSWFNATNYSMGVFTFASDQQGQFFIDVSNDGVTSVGAISGRYDQPAFVPLLKTLAVAYPFYRVRFTMGDTASTFFYFTVMWHKYKSKDITQTVNGTINRISDVTITRNTADFLTDIARGKFRGITTVRKFGRNPDVDTGSVPETVWNGGGIIGLPAVAEPLRVAAGGNVADTLLGAGARTVVLEGLDENWEEATETVDLDGLLASSPTTTTFIRLNRAYIGSVGTVASANVGTITIIGATTLGTLAVISAGVGQTQLGSYSVPAGKTAALGNFSVGVNRASGTTTNVTLHVYAVRAADVLTSPKRLLFTASGSLGQALAGASQIPVILPEKTDILPEVVFCNLNNTDVSVVYDLVLYTD